MRAMVTMFLQSDLVFPDDGDQFTALKDVSRRLIIPTVSCDDNLDEDYQRKRADQDDD
jgi:hypothetical protein